MLKKINIENVINNTNDAIKDYCKFIKNNELLASEDVKVNGSPDSNKCSIEYTSEEGNFKIILDKTKNKVVAKAEFNGNKYSATTKNDEVEITGIAPVHSEHWSKFNKIFEEDNEFMI